SGQIMSPSVPRFPSVNTCGCSTRMSVSLIRPASRSACSLSWSRYASSQGSRPARRTSRQGWDVVVFILRFSERCASRGADSPRNDAGNFRKGQLFNNVSVLAGNSRHAVHDTGSLILAYRKSAGLVDIAEFFSTVAAHARHYYGECAIAVGAGY